MLTTPRSLGVALGMFVVIGCDPGSTGPCKKLENCCRSLEGEDRSACLSQLEAAEDTATPRLTCDALLDGYRSWDSCGGSSSSSDESQDTDDTDHNGVTDESIVTDGDDGAASGQDVCERYLACAGAASPETLPSLISTYGPDGTCWSSGESIAATCLEACINGLSDLQEQGVCEKDPEDLTEDEQLATGYCEKVELCVPEAAEETCEADFLAALAESDAEGGECASATRAFVDCVVTTDVCEELQSCPDPSGACGIEIPEQ
jgi:hypothetical protein